MSCWPYHLRHSVHENMCIMGRPFAIEMVRSWGWPAGNLAVMRELVDVM